MLKDKCDWAYLSKNSNITFEIIKNNPDICPSKTWDWYNIAMNENITWDIVKNNPFDRWNYRSLSGNTNIAWDIVCNSGINIEWRYRYMYDKKWSVSILMQNPNLTFEIIDKWYDLFRTNWGFLSSNEFEKHPALIKKKKREDMLEFCKRYFETVGVYLPEICKLIVSYAI